MANEARQSASSITLPEPASNVSSDCREYFETDPVTGEAAESLYGLFYVTKARAWYKSVEAQHNVTEWSGVYRDSTLAEDLSTQGKCPEDDREPADVFVVGLRPPTPDSRPPTPGDPNAVRWPGSSASVAEKSIFVSRARHHGWSASRSLRFRGRRVVASKGR